MQDIPQLMDFFFTQDWIQIFTTGFWAWTANKATQCPLFNNSRLLHMASSLIISKHFLDSPLRSLLLLFTATTKARIFFLFFSFSIFPYFAFRLCVFSFWSLVTYDRDSDILLLLLGAHKGIWKLALISFFCSCFILRSGFGS
ncbi:hypothetical protein GGI43DRAFT_394986 [Trichoderma evansii]